MREIGIIKWFDALEGYGYVSRIDKFGNLYIHMDQVKCNTALLSEGTFVTYETPNNGIKTANKMMILNDDNSPEIIEKAYYHSRNGIWQHGFKKYVPTIKHFDDETIKHIILKLNSDRTNTKLVEYVPDKLLSSSPILYKYLTPEKQLKLLLNKLSNSSQINKNVIISKIVNMLSENNNTNSKKLWELLPIQLLSENNIFDISPVEKRFYYYVYFIQNENNSIIFFNEFLNFMKQYPDFSSQIPESILIMNNELFNLLPPQKQVELYWNKIDHKWNELSTSAKLMAVYKCASENENYEIIINKLKNNQETNQLVRAYLLVLSSKKHKKAFIENNQNIFQIVHNSLQTYFLNSDYYPRRKLAYILPICNFNVTSFCEARTWLESNNSSITKKNDFGNEVAFCPRKAASCEIGDSGARLYNNPKKHWSLWTLAELLNNCNLIPNLPELRKNDVYLMKLNGWINRLIEIRDRMICSKCKYKLISNESYAKNLAVYNSTVAKCKFNHESVYLSHCWACHQIIDSRESNVKFKNYYLCKHCGSGPKKNTNLSFSQGDICPKCSSKNMIDQDKSIKKCKHCNHEIKLPLDKYLTGNNITN